MRILILVILWSFLNNVIFAQETFFKLLDPFVTVDRLPQTLLIDDEVMYIATSIICESEDDQFSCLGVSKHELDGSLIWERTFEWAIPSNKRGIVLRNDSLFIGGHITPGGSTQVYKLLVLDIEGDSLLARTFDLQNQVNPTGLFSNGIHLSDNYIYNFGMGANNSDEEVLPVHRYDLTNDTDTLLLFKPEFGVYFPGWDMHEDDDGNLLVFNEVYRIQPNNSSQREILKINKDGQVIKRLYGPDTGVNSSVDNEFVLLDNGTYFFMHHVDPGFIVIDVPQLINMDISGTILWTIDFPLFWQDDLIGKINVREVITAANGDIILTGNRERKMDLGSGNDIWLMRIDIDGNILWEKTYNTIEDPATDMYHYHTPTDVQELSDGSLMVIGIAFHHDDIVLLKVDANGCLDAYECDEDILLANEELETLHRDETIHIYPNPSDGRFNLTSDFSLQGTYLLYDIDGHLVDEQSVQNTSNVPLDYTELPDGLYFLVVKTKEATFSRKMVISR